MAGIPTMSGPDFNLGSLDNAAISNFTQAREAKRIRDEQDLKNMAEFQSNLRMNELAKTLALQHQYQGANAPVRGGVVGPVGHTTDPFEQEKINQLNERLMAQERNNADKNKIATDALSQKGKLAEENMQGQLTRNENTNKTREDIAGQNNTTRSDIANNANNTRLMITDKNNTNRTNLQKTKGQQMMDQIAAKGQEARQTKSTKSGNAGQDLPSQQIKNQANIATQIQNENPNWAKYITIDPNTGQVHVQPPPVAGGGTFGMGKADPNYDNNAYHSILQKLYPPSPSMNNQQEPEAQPTVTPSHVPVWDSKGNPYMFDTTVGPVPKGFSTSKPGGDEPESEDEESDEGGSQSSTEDESDDEGES